MIENNLNFSEIINFASSDLRTIENFVRVKWCGGRGSVCRLMATPVLQSFCCANSSFALYEHSSVRLLQENHRITSTVNTVFLACAVILGRRRYWLTISTRDRNTKPEPETNPTR